MRGIGLICLARLAQCGDVINIHTQLQHAVFLCQTPPLTINPNLTQYGGLDMLRSNSR